MKTLLLTIALMLTVTTVFCQPLLKFGNYTLEAGTDRQPGSKYRFHNVMAGVDAIVNFQSASGGATLDSVDQMSSGFMDGFQPLVGVPAHSNGYLQFKINFVVLNTNTAFDLPLMVHTAIDIDGHQNVNDSLYEWESVSMGNGSVSTFPTAINKLSNTTSGGWITGKNMEGVEYTGIDTAAKGVMFSVSNTMINQYLLRVGIDNRSGWGVSRQRSSYFQQFAQPVVVVLPIKLGSFTATLSSAKKVDLRWTTLSEINANHFIIERSVDGVNYADAGIVFAKGNSTNSVDYSMLDNIAEVKATIIYYRLRSIDDFGKNELSETRIIRIAKTTENKLSIVTYPNPVANQIRITNPSTWQNKQVTYEVYAVNGQMVSKTAVAAASQTEAANVSNLQPGIYTIRAICNGEVATQKIVKQ